ncbi:MAG: sialate O-acetylesterase [Oscillospiraceae bacterium]|nr:sialate O-acetylesterase [Oscillospiraceae bacterium]
MSVLRAAAIFSDNMVLQKGRPIKVWGYDRSGKTVRVDLDGTYTECTCVKNRWCAVLPPQETYRKGLVMTITDGDDTITFTDVCIGEVWIAGGQSNMELELQNEKNGAEELKNCSSSDVRFYYTKKNPYIDEFFYIDERDNCWHTADSENARYWSAVGYYFGKEIAAKMGVTVGIIGCNWGGTSASAWTDTERLRADCDTKSYVIELEDAMAGKTEEEYLRELDEYNEYVAQWQPKINEFYAKNPNGTWEEAQAFAGEARYPEPLGTHSPFRAGGLYETMLKRIAPYTVRGCIYYQGESDDHKPFIYEKLLTMMIDNWRELWDDRLMPFIFVQLPMHRWVGDDDTKNWCLIREAQMNVYRKLRNTGLAVALDCGEFNNIHPADKTVVAHRLALQALYMVYGKVDKNTACAPMLTGCQYGKDKVTAYFENVGDGWKCTSPVNDDFEIAGSDGIFHKADEVELSDGKIIISSEKVSCPTAVRYQWTNYAEVRLFGSNGLPLAPFRHQIK